jgi:hypothetical protein
LKICCVFFYLLFSFCANKAKLSVFVIDRKQDLQPIDLIC